MTGKVDYDTVAPAYDRRYADNEYPGTESALREFAGIDHDVLEVGCGTGHWLALLQVWGCRATGVDPSEQMLGRAVERASGARLLRGRGEAIPCADASFDRVVCINTLHHVEDKPRFIAEARRVLRPGGRFMAIGLDPSQGPDLWCIYEYWPSTLALDRARYPRCEQVRAWLAAAGFAECASHVAERIRFDRGARESLERGLLAKTTTSQLTLLDDAEYERGIAAIQRALEAAEARGDTLRLSADLRLYATIGSVPR
jgi:ubiquinone/menaquinone biosynthesis C-methylase UbiE